MKIKKYIYLTLMLLATLLPTSCRDEYETLSTGGGNDKVNWNISVTLPGATTQSTRAFGDSTFTFENLYAAVFVEIQGTYYFNELVPAGNSEPTRNPDTQCWEFGLTLNKTTEPTRIHLIANYPNLTMGFGEEGQLIGRLETDDVNNPGGHDVYWNCVNMPEGIAEEKVKQVQMVPLVRNYAQIQLKKKSGIDNFKITSYALYNTPKHGTVAPYNPTGETVFADYLNDAIEDGKECYVMKYTTGSKTGQIVNKPKDDYLKKIQNGDKINYVMEDNEGKYTFTCQPYDTLLYSQGYEGNEPYDDGTFLVTDLDWKEVTDASDIPVTYIYERSNREATKPTSIIVAGKYDILNNGKDLNDEPVSYYKLDFIYENTIAGTKVRYNLLRNFIYTMNITKVTGPGYETPTEAINKPASNNIGGDALAKDYTNISNGAAQLFVSTTYVLFTNNKPVDIYYKYIPNIENIAITNNGAVNMDAKAGNVLNVDAVRANSDETSGMYTGWRKVTLTPKNPSTEAQYQEITFAAGDLQRSVEMLLRTPYTMYLDVPEEVAKTTKTPLDVDITLPASGIPTSIFPLRMFISSERNTIYPNYGSFIPAESQGGKYGFIREISLDEYNTTEVITIGTAKYKVFNSDFLTNCQASATTVYADNEYFNRASDGFLNPDNMSIKIPNTLPVTIAKINDKYPEKIYNGGTNNGTESVTVTLGNTNLGTIYIDADNVTDIAILANTSAFKDTDVLTFTFQDYSVKAGSDERDKYVTYTASCTVAQLKNGNTLNFTRKRRTTLEIATTQAVTVETKRFTSGWNSTTVYPNKLQTNGTETVNVTVTRGNTTIAESNNTVKIDKDNVTTGVTLNSIGEYEFEDSDIVTFTFTDKYPTSATYNYGNWSYNWSGSNATYTYTCTVKELEDGTTLNFTKPKTEIVIPTTQVVSVETRQFTSGWNSTTVYPYTLQTQNNGKETVNVTVTRGSTTIAQSTNTVKIDKDNVTTGVTLTGNFANDDVITFTFTDRYPTNATYTQSGWNGSWSYTFSNVGTTATYTYECTVEEFEQGVTLAFTTDAF